MRPHRVQQSQITTPTGSNRMPITDGAPPYSGPAAGGFFFWTRFENLVAKRRKINDRVVPILVANVIGMTSYGCQDPRKSLSLPSVLLLDV